MQMWNGETNVQCSMTNVQWVGRRVVCRFAAMLLVAAMGRVGLAQVAATQANPDTSFGLFIGINHYPILKNYDLDGCVNDANAMKRLFVDDRFHLGHSTLLTDEQATREGITKALHDL